MSSTVFAEFSRTTRKKLFILIIYGQTCCFLSSLVLAKHHVEFNSYDDPGKSSDLIMKVASAISIVACIPLMLICSFQSLRNKICIQVVSIIQICNFMSCTGTVFGYLSVGSSCIWQGISTTVFPVSSAFWTLYIIYILYNIVFNDKLLRINYKVHCICWLLPLSFALLP